MTTATPGANGRTGVNPIALAWFQSAAQLTELTERRLVNRRDIWGGYVPLIERARTYTDASGHEIPLGKSLTRPPKKDRGRVSLTTEIIKRHYASLYKGDLVGKDLIGLHSTSPESTSRWGAVDIDHHSEAHDPAANLLAALAWYERLSGLGLHPLLIASNGTGGYHLWEIFNGPVPSPQMFAFVQWLVADFAS